MSIRIHQYSNHVKISINQVTMFKLPSTIINYHGCKPLLYQVSTEYVISHFSHCHLWLLYVLCEERLGTILIRITELQLQFVNPCTPPFTTSAPWLLTMSIYHYIDWLHINNSPYNDIGKLFPTTIHSIRPTIELNQHMLTIVIANYCNH